MDPESLSCLLLHLCQGVPVLISKSFPCVVEQIRTDLQGKYVIVVFAVWGTRYIVVNIYIPTLFSTSTLYTILERVTPYCPTRLLLMGDFNAILAPDLDRPVPPKQCFTDLSTWAQAMGVTEVWRWKHPSNRAYSCFSATYKTSSRIDLAFANPAMMLKVLDARYLPSGLSDHCPLLNICSPTSRTSALWCLGTHWLSHPDLTNTIPPRFTECWELNTGSSSPEVTWDAFKAFTRGQYISSIAGIRREQAVTTAELQNNIDTQTEAYTADPTDSGFDVLNAVKQELHLHLTELARLDLYHNKQRFFEQGNRTVASWQC